MASNLVSEVKTPLVAEVALPTPPLTVDEVTPPPAPPLVAEVAPPPAVSPSEPIKRKFIWTTQDQFNDGCKKISESLEGSKFFIVIHGHGSSKEENIDFLGTIKNNNKNKFIFLDTLKRTLEEALEDNKKIYIIAVSCWWNKKYENFLPVPTISFAPDRDSRLPYHFSALEQKINAIPDDFDEIYMKNWFILFKKNFNMLMNCVAVMDENGKEIIPGGYVLKYRDPMLNDDNTWDSREDENK